MGLFVDRFPGNWKILGAVPRQLYDNKLPGAYRSRFPVKGTYELSSQQSEKISSYLKTVSDMPVTR